MSIDVTPFSVLLNRVLEFRGESTRQFAKHLGVSNRTLNRWLKGTATPSLRSCLLVADHLGLAVEDVLHSANYLSAPAESEIGDMAVYRELRRL